ncbi:ninjurin-A-like [Bacillus rossius redtenbacheri]|uniref:ninjurin-A-like n=1 Tax=Bacillus rossius redtenbacheri TaxID=93214 RepID=UPI002FDDEBB2
MVTITSSSVDVTSAVRVDPAASPKDEPADRADDEVTIVDVEDTTEGTRNKKYASYAAKKTVAQGMMDIALITSNANQLRYLVEYGRKTAGFYFAVTFIVISLMLQVAVGISLIFKGKLDLKGEAKMSHANKINNYVVVGVFLVTIINVFVAAFSVPGESTQVVVAAVSSPPAPGAANVAN